MDKEIKQFLTPSDTSDSSSAFKYYAKNYMFDIDFLFDAVKDNHSVFFYFGDIQKNTFYVSDNMKTQFGLPGNIVYNLPEIWEKKIRSNHALRICRNEFKAILNGQQENFDLYYQVENADGIAIWVHSTAKLKFDDNRTPVFISGKLTRPGEGFGVNSVTNLPEQGVLVEYLTRIKYEGQLYSAIGFSLNNMRQINLSYGRNYGDCIIRSIVSGLHDKLGDRVSFFHLASLKFVAVVKQSCNEQAEEIIEKIREIILSQYKIYEISTNLACSFAMLEYPHGNMSPSDFTENMILLLKYSRKNRTETYEKLTEEIIRLEHERADLELTLSRNVQEGMKNFRIVIQPVVETGTGKIIGGETLLRWKYKGHDITPEIFVPILEREGLIDKTGHWVFEQAVKTCKELCDCKPDISLSVNISLQQLQDENFILFAEKTLKSYDLDGSHMVAEMTESCVDICPDVVNSFLDNCHRLGMRIALDDFGTGYSSMRVLLQYPIDIIKLDRSLLAQMSESEEKRKFIYSIVHACHQIGKRVCIEGVQMEEHKEFAEKAHCDLIQGFYYYRTMEQNKVREIISEN